jgi:hypothetical protein
LGRVLIDIIAQWAQIVSGATPHKYLAEVGKNAGLEACIIANPGATNISPGMVATTLLAIIGLVSVDGGDEAAYSMTARLGLTHKLLEPVNSMSSSSYYALQCQAGKTSIRLMG